VLISNQLFFDTFIIISPFTAVKRRWFFFIYLLIVMCIRCVQIIMLCLNRPNNLQNLVYDELISVWFETLSGVQIMTHIIYYVYIMRLWFRSAVKIFLINLSALVHRKRIGRTAAGDDGRGGLYGRSGGAGRDGRPDHPGTAGQHGRRPGRRRGRPMFLQDRRTAAGPSPVPYVVSAAEVRRRGPVAAGRRRGRSRELRRHLLPSSRVLCRHDGRRCRRGRRRWRAGAAVHGRLLR